MANSTYVLGLTVLLSLLGYIVSLAYGAATDGQLPNFGMIACGVYAVLVLAYVIVREIFRTLMRT